MIKELPDMPELKPIDPQPLEDSLSTLQRLQIEHFPDSQEKERVNFQKRVEELKTRITPFI